MVRQTGGLQWKQGEDGCIFLPAVECEGQEDKYSTNPDLLSKVVPKGLPDETTESFIEAHFPDVVRGKGVLISLKRCTPRFSDERNKNKSKNVANEITGNIEVNYLMLPCQRIDFTKPQNYTNFVMEKYADETFYKIAKTAEYFGNAEKCWKLLRRALNAAIALVPDNGPWVLGYDFHVNNIFVKMDREPYTSLADWGRIILIEDPNDPASVLKGLQDGLQNLKNVGFSGTEYYDYPKSAQFPDKIGNALDVVMSHAKPRVPTPRERQHWRQQRRAGLRVSEPRIREGKIHPDIHKARLTTLYGILNNAATALPFLFTDIDFSEFGDFLFHTQTQKEIIDIVNRYIKVPGIDKYIDLNTFFPSGSSGASSTPKKGFFSRLFRMGGNRTRKQKLRRFRSQRTHKFRKNEALRFFTQ